ncbi:MAG: glycogen synthase [Patescibacteria group bacterium]|nr:glycogen synthase [Patescibacteria group bacterium]
MLYPDNFRETSFYAARVQIAYNEAMDFFPHHLLAKPRKVLFISPEAAPFAKAGGLGEVMFSLPMRLAERGFDARVFMPLYAHIDTEKFRIETEMDGLMVPTDAENENEPRELACNVKKFTPHPTAENHTPVTTYFLQNQEYFELRSNIYGYADDPVRWALLSRGVLEFLRRTRNWVPDIIVASDWQTGFLVDYLRTTYRDDPRLKRIPVIFAIHNLYYQGVFDHRFVSEMDFDDGRSPIPSFFDPRLLKLNMMRRGILHADLIATVSPTYAKEITTKDYGELLDGLLRERRSRLYGVLNGINYDVFNPKTNVNLKRNFDLRSINLRHENKKELQGRLGLNQERRTFLIGIVSRLTEQKGFDLLFPIADALLKELKFQLVILGDGESKYMSFFQELEGRFPGQVAAHLAFDTAMPHLIYAGADAILIPSKFEPCGLTQMEAMRYGAVPIARRTGGLADSVIDYDPETGHGTGFSFSDFDTMPLMIAVVRALESYKNPQAWKNIERQCMEKDFSWKRSAAEYTHLFDVAADLRKRDLAE